MTILKERILLGAYLPEMFSSILNIDALFYGFATH
jgi:hypothetical protein